MLNKAEHMLIKKLKTSNWEKVSKPGEKWHFCIEEQRRMIVDLTEVKLARRQWETSSLKC